MSLIAVLVWVASGLAAPAQRWTPAQQEIIELVRRCNDAWVASHAEKRFEVYDGACPATDKALFWYTAGDTPVTYKGPTGLWVRSLAENRGISWRDLEPVAVQIEGDVAYIYYSVTWLPQPKADGEARRRSRRLNVFQRRNGQWLMSGGTIAPVPD